MKMKHLFLTLSAVAVSHIGFAAEISATPGAQASSAQPAIATSSATFETKVPSGILDKIYVNYFTIYHGASLKDPGSNYALDRTGKLNKIFTTNLDSELTAAYMVTKDIGIGPVAPFLLVQAPGQHFILGDIGVKAFNRKTISLGGFNLYSNIILQAPTSDLSQSRHQKFAIKTTPNVRYTIPHSDFKLGAWTEAKAYIGANKGKTFKLYAAPYVNYSLSDNFSLNLEYEMEAHHYLGASTFDFTNYQTDLQPGFVWNITKHILVNPYVQLFTGNKITVENSALGAIFSATLL